MSMAATFSMSGSFSLGMVSSRDRLDFGVIKIDYTI
jgi:hypothetical protein